MHGPTYMGNPLACAVALANLDLLATGDWREPGRPDQRRADRAGSRRCRDLPGVADVRTIGAVGVVQLDHPVDVGKATEAALDSGVWLRPFRDLVYTMPPYVSTDDDVARICAAIERAAVDRVDDAWDGLAAPTQAAAARAGRAAPVACGRARADDGVIDLAGNDYLGLSRHPRGRRRRGRRRARTWGAGAGASRLVTGTLDLHAELEAALADFLGQPAALVFSTGYHANLAAVTALADRDTLIVSDAHIHASLVDACRLARGRGRGGPAQRRRRRVDARSRGADGRAGAGPGRVGLLRARRRRAAGRAGRGLRGVRRAAGRRRGARPRRRRRRRTRAGARTSAWPGRPTSS